MILQTLNDYYQRLADDPNSDIAPFGFSLQNISFCIVLEPDGQLHAIQPVTREADNGKAIPQQLIVLGQNKPPGSGVNPCFLWDNSVYLLGFKPDDPKPERTAQCFDTFRQKHIALGKEVNDPQFFSVCRFLENWSPERAIEYPDLENVATAFGVFRIRGEAEYVHKQPAVLNWWNKQLDQSDTNETESAMCLITGQVAPLARLHEPKIKKVGGAQSTGASIVSFNLDAFESYGKSQSYNAPVSKQAAFQYTTALNHLLADRDRKVIVGDTTTVFWTDQPDPAEQLFPAALAGFFSKETEDDDKAKSIKSFLQRLRQGKPDTLANQLEQEGIDAHKKFYILGLAPNASRIAIRFWLVGTVGQFAKRLAEHVQAVEIVGIDERFPTIKDLLRETVRDGNDVQPLLAGSMTRAVLSGSPYPLAFYQAILRRCHVIDDPGKRKDWRRAMTYRAAALKAVLIRNYKKEISMSLDSTRTDPPYLLGRLFACYEKIQKEALGEKLNRTVKDSFYGAASTTPASVFPRLCRLSQHHLSKLKSEKTGLAIIREKLIGQIVAELNDFPQHLKLVDQGLFHIGYYHQNQDFYTSKKTADNNSANNESE